jgi:hypothetical protein
VLICLGVYMFAMIASFALMGRLRDYRIDIKPGQSDFEGSSTVGQLNVFFRSNYSPAGRKLLPWLWVVQLLAFAFVLWFVFSD